MSTSDATGQCYCGAVSFYMAFPSKWVAHCHCTQCQRAHGAAFVTWVSVNDAQVTIEDPHKQLQWHVSAESARRGFCARCGSSLFFASPAWPGELHIARAAFTEEIDRLPQAHGYYDTHVAWFEVNDELPKKNDPNTR